MTTTLELIAERGQDGAPIGRTADTFRRFLSAAPSSRVPAEPDVKCVECEQVPELEAGDPGLIETVEFGGKLANGLQSRSTG